MRHKNDSYVEAMGEQCMSFYPSEIVGWVYVDGLQEMLDMNTNKEDKK